MRARWLGTRHLTRLNRLTAGLDQSSVTALSTSTLICALSAAPLVAAVGSEAEDLRERGEGTTTNVSPQSSAVLPQRRPFAPISAPAIGRAAAASTMASTARRPASPTSASRSSQLPALHLHHQANSDRLTAPQRWTGAALAGASTIVGVKAQETRPLAESVQPDALCLAFPRLPASIHISGSVCRYRWRASDAPRWDKLMRRRCEERQAGLDYCCAEPCRHHQSINK